MSTIIRKSVSTVRPMARYAAAALLRQEARFGKSAADAKFSRELEAIADEFDVYSEGRARSWASVRRLFGRLGLGEASSI